MGRKTVDEGLHAQRGGRVVLVGHALLLACVMVLALGFAQASTPARAATDVTASTLPPGFQEEVVFSGLVNPTAVRFASDGRVFVAEKSGLIKIFDNLSDTTPTTFADLRTNVYNFWDRGLLGLALHPNFPATPWVYVLYTYDHVLGDSNPPPRWGTPGATSDPCPTPPGANSDGCVVSGRLSRLQASGNTMVGSEQVLIEDWCQQYPSHSIGALQFGSDGALYVSGGDGASFTFVDWGQDGNPLNPCGDPPVPAGGAQTPPTAEGGALRSQDLRTTTDPVSLDGTLIRVDDTGAALPTNPLFGNPDQNAKRVIAYGLRNPFRFTMRPGTSEIWVGDVGGGNWEEINRITNPTSGVLNFGWPCYEGPARMSSFDNANLNICENLYAEPNADTKPYFTYHHNNKVVAGESCPTGSSSISGLAFEFSTGASPYPPAYRDALFFADYSRKCIWVMKKGGDGHPAPGLIETFVAEADGPVDLERGPAGEIYYVDFDGGTIRRIGFTGGQPSTPYPTEVLADTPALYWRLGEASGSFADSSGHGLDGAAAGSGLSRAAPDLVSSNSDRALTFTDGTSYVTRASMSSLSATAVTVEAWLRPSAHSNWIDVANHSWGSLGGWVLFTDAGGNARFGIWGSGGSQILVSAAGVQVNAASHLVGTYDGSVLRLYLNGALVGTRTANALSLNTTGGLFTGRTDTAAQTTVDELAVYPTALSPSRIQAHYNASFGGTSNQPPTASITSPTQTTTWRVGTQINFSGGASDPEDGTLPASALDWSIILHHCPSNCHTHVLQTFENVASGSFTAPDHEYPSFIEVRLTATDSGNASDTDSVELQPRTVTLTLQSAPTGLQLSLNLESAAAPFTRTVIEGSTNSVSAPNQSQGGTPYTFASWSDGGAQSHNLVANTSQTLTATFSAGTPTEVYPGVVLADSPRLYWRLGETSDPFADSSGNGNTGTASGSGLSRGQPDLVADNSDRALSFTDGTSNVSRGAVSGMSSSALTVETWFRVAAHANWIDLANSGWGSVGGWSMFTNSSGALYFGLWQTGGVQQLVGVTGVQTNAVNHAVGTYDGNVLRLYLNGVLVASKTTGALSLSTTFGLLTGRTDTTSVVTVDELAVYSTALSTARIQAHYAAGT